MSKIAPYMKAIVAIVGALVTAVLTQFPDNDTVQQWGPIVSALLTAVSVYAVPNKDPEAAHQDESVQPPSEGGIVTTELCLLVIAVASVVFVLFGANLVHR